MKVTFNGYDLTSAFIVGNLVRQKLLRTHNLIEVAGRDGQIFGGSSLDPIEITMTLTYIDNNPQTKSEGMRILAGMLNVDEPKQLAFEEDGGLYYMAIPNGGDIARYVGAEQIEITFTCPDPAMYGETKTITVPSGGTVTFEVGGTTYTKPTFTANATRDSSSQLWGLRLDNSDYIQIATGSASAVSVVCDCEKRTLKVGNTQTLPTLTSDWFVLTPATHTLKNDVGTGAATVVFTERWL